ncbi:MAG TPA: RNA-binding S4 domain-containing protein [Caulobacteraceae bacterium]|jgi:ribosome-associated heat shock protein Hsp15|nr:RNA-binding S4 domain-containing protein [Caulobacteraceae bacterium]
MAEDACRIDVWLWRARFSKTRSLAARLAEEGRIRLARNGVQTRLDKASRTVRPGDELVFAIAGRLTAVRVVSLGERRGPASEARELYAPLTPPEGGDASGAE